MLYPTQSIQAVAELMLIRLIYWDGPRDFYIKVTQVLFVDVRPTD